MAQIAASWQAPTLTLSLSLSMWEKIAEGRGRGRAGLVMIPGGCWAVITRLIAHRMKTMA
ncbi:hypothetical protein GCM10023307_10970 [Lysobacter hankyongensis]|uniref:Uncharacterized protein n=1 Tax=Lysobacter hankyongensis TaxID=1176535 RepID=A0ABP9B0T9_9GAMM